MKEEKMALTEEQLERYSRHILLKDVGAAGQKRVLDGKVVLIGLGGLGSPVALYLAAAGIGTLGIVDGDAVELSNLQRQVIHHTPDIGRAKVDSVKEKITRLNPDVRVQSYPERVMTDNIIDIIKGYDFVIDCTDNFPTKFLINDACVQADKPFSHAGVLGFTGQTMTVIPVETACYRCLFSSPPPSESAPSTSRSGVLGTVAGIVGTIQATEALKFLLGTGDMLTDRLLTFDSLKMKFRTVEVKKDPKCAACGDKP